MSSNECLKLGTEYTRIAWKDCLSRPVHIQQLRGRRAWR